MPRNAYVIGVGTALPGPALAQQDMWAARFAAHFGGDRAAERLFLGAGVRSRHAAVNPAAEDVSGWSTGARMRRYRTEALPVGKDAVGAALADAGLRAEDIGQFTVASCTGYATPGLDIQIAADLGMTAALQRLVVGHMGCYAALPGLGVVTDYVVSRRRPAVLLCCELTSLHVQPPTDDRAQVISHALFGDAAAAVVVAPERTRHGPALQAVDVAALTDARTAGHMTWDVTDLGFRMGLSPRVPDVLSRHVGGVIAELLDGAGLRIEDVAGWAVHPGGPRILDVVRDQLGLVEEQMAASRRVLAEHGNCSSATVLLVLQEMADVDGPVVVMAFGPGLTLYAALLLPA
jgi:predicted naringenin-chalcone synthase